MAGGQIAIIGAGMAGLACARRLADAGITPVILDKGRGLGGRLATRRTASGLQFDHGAQYATGRDPAFRAFLAEAEQVGFAGRWTVGSKLRTVGTPGMNALAKHLARGLEVCQQVEVTRVRRASNGWTVDVNDAQARYDRLVITVPAPQTGDLLGSDHELATRVSDVRMTPCLTLMAAFPAGTPTPFETRRDAEDPLAWIALDNSKPGRMPDGMNDRCWVAQAGPAWSAHYLNRDPADIATSMLAMLCDRIGASPSSVSHAAAHRWRYAGVAEALGEPFVRNGDATLYLGGDWCLRGRLEAAWSSGTAIANDILANT